MGWKQCWSYGAGGEQREDRRCAPHAQMSPCVPTVSMQSPEEEKKGEKIYLYMHLKQQPIW